MKTLPPLLLAVLIAASPAFGNENKPEKGTPEDRMFKQFGTTEAQQAEMKKIREEGGSQKDIRSVLTDEQRAAHRADRKAKGLKSQKRVKKQKKQGKEDKDTVKKDKTGQEKNITKKEKDKKDKKKSAEDSTSVSEGEAGAQGEAVKGTIAEEVTAAQQVPKIEQ